MGADTLVNPQHDSLNNGKQKKGISISVLQPGASFLYLNVSGSHTGQRSMVQAGTGGSPQLPDDDVKCCKRSPERLFSALLHTEFNTALAANRVINPPPLLSAEYPFTDSKRR